ncbi:uncharacterized protein (DUF1330 family) [Dokdonella fugitiva]|uniref:Uncharacterized protein (DUF1330 family) n=1 Tax=Dokdonella fugitiva TaxID=328517 RepID=A0A839F7I3_9GAMM|nr:DUF1330 domain-containing protein [Dokdonella fugitiva]MBA8888174.1 uncharacterized protein (DUF1330 family) [Dokdonella fugitiva]
MVGATIVVVGTFRAGYEAVFAEYSARVRRFLDRKGARAIRRQRIERVLYGTRAPSLLMLIDFPSREVAATAFFEQDYLDIIPLREQVFSAFEMFLAPLGDV